MSEDRGVERDAETRRKESEEVVKRSGGWREPPDSEGSVERTRGREGEDTIEGPERGEENRESREI